MIIINTIKCELSHKSSIATLGYGLFLLKNLFPQTLIFKLFIKNIFSIITHLSKADIQSLMCVLFPVWAPPSFT